MAAAVLRNLRRGALAGALAVSSATGAHRLVARRFGGRGSILMFHSVVTEIARELGQSIHVHAQVLRNMVIHLRNDGREIVTLDEALERLAQPPGRPFVVLTFDDGYRNNLTHALPVLEALGAPFTIYINTAMVEGTIDAWWLGLRDLMLAHERVEVQPMGATFKTATTRQKASALLLVTDWVHKDIDGRSRELKRTFSRYGIDTASIARREALAPVDLHTLARHPLVTLGGHAESHRPLSSLGEEDALGEMVRNKHMLEDAAGCEVRHFAYPFGNTNAAGAREAALARRAGFATAVTSRSGNLFAEHLHDPMMLPRVAVLNQDRNAHLDAKLAGVEELLRRPFRTPGITP